MFAMGMSLIHENFWWTLVVIPIFGKASMWNLLVFLLLMFPVFGVCATEKWDAHLKYSHAHAQHSALYKMIEAFFQWALAPKVEEPEEQLSKTQLKKQKKAEKFGGGTVRRWDVLEMTGTRTKRGMIR